MSLFRQTAKILHMCENSYLNETNGVPPRTAHMVFKMAKRPFRLTVVIIISLTTDVSLRLLFDALLVVRKMDPTINTISKTLEAQEKTQDIKQSPSTKIGTKPYARSRRNELTEVTGRWTRRWRKVTRRSDQEA